MQARGSEVSRQTSEKNIMAVKLRNYQHMTANKSTQNTTKQRRKWQQRQRKERRKL